MNHCHKRETVAVKRTQTILSHTLFDLLTKMPFEKISLTELCNTSLIPRTTFYRYFEDKYDLLRFCLKKTFEGAGLNEDVVFFKNKDSIKAFLLAIIRYTEANKTLYTQIYTANKNGTLLDLSRNCIMEIVTEKFQMEQDCQNRTLLISRPIFSTLLSDFYFSTIKCYLEQAEHYTVEEYVENVCAFIEKDFLIRNEE